MPKEKKETHTHSKQGPPMMVNGSADSEMDMVFKNGQMVLNMKVSGKITEPMVKENSYILMEISMMENGLMIRQMAMVSIIISTVPCMRDTGEMISSMVKARSHGLMAQSMKAIIWLAKSTEWVFTAGMTAANTPVNGMKTKLKDLEHTAG